MALLYYCRRQPHPTVGRGILTLVVSLVLMGSVLTGFVPGLPTLAGDFEVFFVNRIGLPFN